jgi:hypothetical protein
MTFEQAARHTILRVAKDAHGTVRSGVHRETVAYWPNGIAYQVIVKEYFPTPKERIQMTLEKSRIDPDTADGLMRLVEHVDESVLEEAMTPRDQRRLIQ